MSLTCLPTSARTRACAVLRASSSRAARERGEAFERKLGVDREQAAVAGQADDAIGAGAVRQRELELVGAGGQAVAHDRLHPPLAEGAARLLVGENVLQRHDFARHLGQARLRRVDHREALVELAEVLARVAPRPDTRARCRASRPCRRGDRRAPALALAERRKPRLDRLLPFVGDSPLARRAAAARQRAIRVRSSRAPSARNAAPSASGRKIGTPSMTAMRSGHSGATGDSMEAIEQK